MADSKVSNLLALMKQQMESQEALFEYLIKIDAMVEVILVQDLIGFPAEKMHSYLWIVSDLIGRAKELNEDLLNRSVKVASNSLFRIGYI